MKKLVFNLLIAVFSITSAFATDAEEMVEGQISGTIQFNENNEPVIFASVALINEANEIITGTTTNESGKFNIEHVKPGKYQLRISYLGYQTKVIEPVVVDRQHKEVNLGVTTLQESTQNIEEAVVTAERLKGEEKADRTVFTLNDDLRKAASKGIDVLKFVPSLHVDFQENISMEGSSNILIYVDGVERNKDFLAQLDPSLIDKVEVISNPGVKYDAAVDGVINIILKKEKRYGVNGSATMEIPSPNSILWNPAGNIEYGNQHFRVYAGNRLHYERFSGSETSTLTYKNINSDLLQFAQEGKGTNSWRNNHLNYGADWFISDRSTINIYGSVSGFKAVAENYMLNNTSHFRDEHSTYFETDKDYFDEGTTNYVSLFYKLKTSEDDELTSEINYYDYIGITNNDLTDYYYNGLTNQSDLLYVISRNELIRNYRSSTEYKLDYALTHGMFKHEFGLRNYMQWMKSREMDEGIEQGLFEYDEWRQAGYYNVAGKHKSFSFNAGLRLEHSNTVMENDVNADYWAFLPQANLQQQFKNKQSLKFSYRRNIHRPNITDLNPFETWSDSLHVSYGNPNLNPAFYHNFELNYSKNFESNYVSLKAFYNHNENGIRHINELSEKGIFITRLDNIGKSREYGFSVATALQLAPWYRFHAWSQLSNNTFYLSNASNDVLGKKWDLNTHLTSLFIMPKDFTIFIDAHYRSPHLQYQTVNSRDFLVVTGLSKKIGDNWEVSGIYVPFIKEFTYQRRETATADFVQNWEGKVNAENLFSIKAEYKFNVGGKIKKLNRSTEYEKDGGKSLM